MPSAVGRSSVRPVSVGTLVRWVVAIVLCLIALVPIWWMFNVVFSDAGSALSLSPRLYPTSLQGGIANLTTVLSDGSFAQAFINSIKYSTVTALLVLLFASAAAYEFAHYTFPFRRFLYGLCLVGLMLPLAVIIIPTQRIVVELGWLNTLQGIVLPSTASAFALFFLLSICARSPANCSRLPGSTAPATLLCTGGSPFP